MVYVETMVNNGADVQSLLVDINRNNNYHFCVRKLMIIDTTKYKEAIPALREALEMQFRHQFYKDPKFPFLQSIGIKDVFQSFGSEEFGDIGTLRLYYKDGGWKSQWFESHEDALEIVNNLYTYFRVDKVYEIFAKVQYDLFKKQRGKQETEEEEDLSCPVELLN